MKQLLTYEEAHRLFRYDLETGKLYWRVSSAFRVKAGDEAGCVKRIDHLQYRHIMANGKSYLAHRIAWLMLYGAWPKHNIDHLDGDGLNNRPGNMREVMQAVNNRNSRMQRNNTSGVTGVNWYKPMKKWCARSNDDNGKRKHLGYFDDIREAERVVREFQAERGFSERHGFAC